MLLTVAGIRDKNAIMDDNRRSRWIWHLLENKLSARGKNAALIAAAEADYATAVRVLASSASAPAKKRLCLKQNPNPLRGCSWTL